MPCSVFVGFENFTPKSHGNSSKPSKGPSQRPSEQPQNNGNGNQNNGEAPCCMSSFCALRLMPDSWSFPIFSSPATLLKGPVSIMTLTTSIFSYVLCFYADRLRGSLVRPRRQRNEPDRACGNCWVPRTQSWWRFPVWQQQTRNIISGMNYVPFLLPGDGSHAVGCITEDCTQHEPHAHAPHVWLGAA